MSAKGKNFSLNAIVERILDLLQFDVVGLFTGATRCRLCCPAYPHFPTPQPNEDEVCVEHQYDRRPLIFDGGARAIDIDRKATCFDRGCDGAEDTEESHTVCEEQSENDYIREEAEAAVECKVQPEYSTCDRSWLEESGVGSEEMGERMAFEVAEKCSSATLLEMQSLEERAERLWSYLNENIRPSCGKGKLQHWWDLKSWQKLPFYWAALSNEVLHEDPLENFKRFYLGNMAGPKCSAKKADEEVLIVWHGLSYKQRLPFIMEAFVGRVAAGKVNMSDEYDIRRAIGNLQKKF